MIQTGTGLPYNKNQSLVRGSETRYEGRSEKKKKKKKKKKKRKNAFLYYSASSHRIITKTHLFKYTENFTIKN